MSERNPGITKAQDKEYVMQHAILLAKMSDDDRTFPQALRDLRTAVAFYEAHDADPKPQGKTRIRRAITLWCEQIMREQGVTGWSQVDRTGWPQCTLVNPLCPDDLCILPATHTGTDEGFHVLGTTAYSAAEDFPLDWMMPRGTNVQVLVQEGWRRADIMFPRDEV